MFQSELAVGHLTPPGAVHPVGAAQFQSFSAAIAAILLFIADVLLPYQPYHAGEEIQESFYKRGEEDQL